VIGDLKNLETLTLGLEYLIIIFFYIFSSTLITSVDTLGNSIGELKHLRNLDIGLR
jgi:hypothetical protein